MSRKQGSIMGRRKRVQLGWEDTPHGRPVIRRLIRLGNVRRVVQKDDPPRTLWVGTVGRPCRIRLEEGRPVNMSPDGLLLFSEFGIEGPLDPANLGRGKAYSLRRKTKS